MKNPSRFWLAALCVLSFFATAERLPAQLTRIFVASYGNDANDGSRGTPKRNFQAAHAAVAAGGQIVVLDTAGYGALTITKSVSLTVPPGVNGFVTISGPTIAINVSAGANDTVSLRGLIIENSAPSGLSYAISVAKVGTLTVEDCLLRNTTEGVFFNSSNSAELYAHRVTARGCAEGFNIQPTGAYTYKAVMTNCLLEKNSLSGLAIFSTTSGSAVNLLLADSVLTGNTNANLFAQGNIVVRVDNCRITGSSSGAGAFNGAQILSRGNNTLENNSSNNTFPGTYSAK